VAGGGLDDHLEGAELPAELENLVGLRASECFPSQHLSLLVHDADGYRLLVKVDADEVHCRAPGLGKWGIGKNSSSLPQNQRFCKPSRRPSRPSHSFNFRPPTLRRKQVRDEPARSRSPERWA